MGNQLATASSPYLRQHADNPVHWQEWGEAAFEEARRRDVPVFLSVGYSSCHWCHVMAHESFEDDEVARVLNDNFVSIKVDREQRPDVDAVYMDAVQALSGRGGWPMSVFTTPDGTPFFGGTYWPKDDRAGMPGFLRVLGAVLEAWRTRREDVLGASKRLSEHLQAAQEIEGTAAVVDAEVADRAARSCVQAWDTRDGGFGGAPKFPQAMTIDFLLSSFVRTGDSGAMEAAVHSLEMMSRGGIYDHVAGGFARYSVDEHWLVPHFEKMLYDNALLLRAYTHAARLLGDAPPGPRFRRVATEVADYLLRDMQSPRGGFYSATDADSEGEEGRYFLWSGEEFDEVVAGAGEDPTYWRRFFAVTDQGDFVDPHVGGPKRNILHEPEARDEADEAFGEAARRVLDALRERRSQRVPPGLDDKILTSWNGLVIGGLAEAGALLARDDFVEAARACARFLEAELVVDARLHHTWSEGHGAAVPAFLEDVAFLAQGLLSLYEADHDPRWVAWARTLTDEADARYADGDSGTYFTTAADAEQLLTRPKEMWDNATPAGSSVLADVQLRLAGLTGDLKLRERAQRTLAAFAPRALQAPTAYGELLRALERLLQGPRELAIIGSLDDARTGALITVHRSALRPGDVLAVGPCSDVGAEAVPLLAGREPVDGMPAAYVCRELACERPVTSPAELAALLG